MVKYIVPLLTVLFQRYVIELYFSKVAARKEIPAKKRYFFLVVIGLIQYFNIVLFQKTIYMFLISIVIVFLLSLFYEIKAIMRVLFCFFLIVIMSLSEYIAAFLITTITQIPIEQTQNNENVFAYTIAVLSSVLVTFILVSLVPSYDKRGIKSTSRRFLSSMILFPVSTLLVTALLYKEVVASSQSWQSVVIMAAVTLLILSNAVLFGVIDKQTEIVRTKQELEFNKNMTKTHIAHYEDIMKLQQENRKIYHDNKNLYLSVSGLLEDGRVEEAKTFLNEQVGSVINESMNLIKTGNHVLDAVLYPKKKYCVKNNIELKVYSELSVPILINEMEMGVLVGNAVDNAIEATEKIDIDKRKPIVVRFKSFNQVFQLYVENVVEQDIDTNNLQTTKKSKSGHGIGIESMKNIVEKHMGTINFTCEDKVFCVSAMLNNTVDTKEKPDKK